MSSHHDNHHAQEPKKVAFGTPLILGLVTLLVIVLLVSTCDTKHASHTEHANTSDAPAHAKH